MRSDDRSSAPPRFAFVLGTGRCGSTLVHEVLARHPATGFITNVEDRVPLRWVGGRWSGPAFRAVPPALTAKGRIRFAPSEAYRLLEREVSPILSTPSRDLTAADVTPWLERRVRACLGGRARAQGRPVFLHKFTGWPRARFLHAIFPEARFIHVIRDGRAVANSFLQMSWWGGYRGPSEWGWGPLPPALEREWEAAARSYPVLAGIEWKILMDAFEEAKAAIPRSQWLEIRYEDFVADPRRILGDVLAFLGLDWNPRFERGFRRYRLEVARVDAFRSDLSPHDLAHLEDSLGDHLARYGYAVPAPAARLAR